MATRVWAPGEFINPGDLRQPRTTAPVVPNQLLNPGFETGDLTDWTVSDVAITVGAFGPPFEGTYCVRHPDGLLGTYFIDNDNVVPVQPGQVIKLGCRYRRETNVTGRQSMAIEILWFDSGMAPIAGYETLYEQAGGASSVWYDPSVTGTAPPGAAFAQARVRSFQTGTGDTHHQYFDAFSWDYIQPVAQTGLVYKAVQANAGFTAATEPVWPIVLGNTVVDNEVTWEAVLASNVTWEATPILLSGATEPTWPVEVGATILDGTIAWEAVSRRITDENCPNSKAVAIAASKIFAADNDIIRFSATVNPLDWSTRDDAGYLPFGLQTYGSNPVAALGLYRSNLVAFNSQGFQMWQVDQDPANMAFLDAVPIGSTYPHSWEPVANDLVGLTAVGVRNVSIAGASTNLQADGVGEPVDSLVKPKIRLLDSDDDALSLFWPAAGQYWVVFEDEAIVLTINGAKKKSWSRYVFPEAITDATLAGNTLVLRTSTGNVWDMSDEVLRDDEHELPSEAVLTRSATFDGFRDGTVPGANPPTGGDFQPREIRGKTINGFYFVESGSQTLYLVIPGVGHAQWFDDITIETNSVPAVVTYASATVTTLGGGTHTRYSWGLAGGTITWTSGGQYDIAFGGDAIVEATDFSGVVQWPYLDMGAIGREKGLVGLDLTCTAPEGVSVSIGYNHNDRTQRTADYEVDADTMTGQMVPFPVSGPSFDLKLTFAPNQEWEWEAANLYVNDWRLGS